MRLLILLVATFLTFSATNAQDLEIIKQNYHSAVTAADQSGKLLLIDFYTTWCEPCKKLDKLIFENDSIRKELGKEFVLLKYNAENDSTYHLSKKYHINSYPTAMILDAKGQAISRKRGFSGEDFASIAKDFSEFVKEGVVSNGTGNVLSGYSNKVDISIYPKFYIDYVDRTNTKVDSATLNEYLHSSNDIFTEQYFSTLIYFAPKASDEIADITLNNKEKYESIYGKTDVEILFYFLTTGKFDRAMKGQNQGEYDKAVAYARNSLSKEWTDDILPSFEREYLMAQNRWAAVTEIFQKMKDNGNFSNGHINHISWRIYKSCDNPEVIDKFLSWMKEVTSEEPTFQYLDTYAFLMYKSGNIPETKRIALLAMDAAKKENRKAKNLQALIDKL